MATHGCTGVPCSICGSSPASSAESKTIVGFGNWTSGWTSDDAGSLSPVFGVDLGAAKDIAYAVVYFPPPSTLYAPSDALTGTDLHITLAGGHCGKEDCDKCDPLERLVDGLTVRECLERYTQRNREYVNPQYDGKLDAERLWWQPNSQSDEYKRESRHPTGWKLTDAQLAAAQQAWSTQLRAKQAEQREKERVSVVCDDDRWEP